MSKVSTIQLNSGPNIKVNLYDVKTFIEQIADVGSKLVVLPENFALMPENDADYIKHAEELGDGQIQNYLSELASSYKIWIVGGSIPIKSKESYNESKYFMPGDKIEVIDTPIGRAGIACCYDLRFPELFRLQQEQKVDVIILPASFTEQTGKVHWETLIKARAIENLSFVVSSCQGGYHINGKKTFGHTMIVNPWGQTLDILEKGKGFISSDIDLSQLKSIRENFPVLEHMKLINKK